MSPDADATPMMLRPPQAARRYGAARSTFYSWIESGQLAHYRIGDVILVKPEDVEKFLEAHRVEPKP